MAEDPSGTEALVTPESHLSRLQDELTMLVKRNDLRSADRANMRHMLANLKQRKELSYEEQQNLWAYLDRYRR